MCEDGFLGNFNHLHERPDMGLSTGPVIGTVLGDVGTTMFDVVTRSQGEETRE